MCTTRNVWYFLHLFSITIFSFCYHCRHLFSIFYALCLLCIVLRAPCSIQFLLLNMLDVCLYISFLFRVLLTLSFASRSFSLLFFLLGLFWWPDWFLWFRMNLTILLEVVAVFVYFIGWVKRCFDDIIFDDTWRIYSDMPDCVREP